MELNLIETENIITLISDGMIDTNTSLEFEDKVDSVLLKKRSIIFDFSKVTYISSAGLRILLKAQKKVSSDCCEMIVKNINESIKEIFEITGFINILTIE